MCYQAFYDGMSGGISYELEADLAMPKGIFLLNEFTIPRDIMALIILEGHNHYPLEACGIISGNDIIEKIYPCVNIAVNKYKDFEIAPREQYDTINKIKKDGLRMLGIYHSHTNGPAWPSDNDFKFALKGQYYIITSVKHCPSIRIFNIE